MAEMAEPTPASSARTRDEVLKDFRTQAILEAARRVIGDLGYADASMERIAQEAGVAKGTLYLYFDSKETLLERAIDYGLDRLLEAARQAVRSRTGAFERIRATMAVGWEQTRENRAFFQSLVDARLARAGREGRAGGFQAYVDLLAELIEEGIRTGELREIDPARAARLVVHGMSGLVAESLIHKRPFPSEADLDDMLDVFFHGLARPREES